MSQNLPSVTVVVPAFNAAAWIADTLASVAAQTYPANLIDIVVVDDASTDGTADHARRALASAGLAYEVLANDSCAGPSAARNRGWRHGKGEWIQFLDADDVIAPTKLLTQASAAHTSGAGVAAAFSSWSRLIRRDSVWMKESEGVDPVIGRDPVVDLLRSDNFMATGSQLFRREWLERVGGYVDSFRFIEDVDLLLRMAFAGATFARVPSPEPLFWYRQHERSLARSDQSAFVDGCLRNARMAEAWWRDRGELTEERARVLAHTFFTAARYYAERDARRFRELADDIERLAPNFVPDEPASLRFLARIVGYASAERCAVTYRQLKRTVGAGA